MCGGASLQFPFVPHPPPGIAQQGAGTEPGPAGAADQEEGVGCPRNDAAGAGAANHNESDAGAEQAQGKVQQDEAQSEL